MAAARAHAQALHLCADGAQGGRALQPAPDAQMSAAVGERRRALRAALACGLLGAVSGWRSVWAGATVSNAEVGTASGAAPVLAAAASPAWPASLALEYEVSVRVSGLPFRVSSHMSWQLRGEHYEAELRMRLPLIGSRTQRSLGRLLPEGLQPLAFSDQSRRLRRFEFDWAAQRYRFQRDTEAPLSGTLSAGTQDQLSLFFQLAWLAQRQPPSPGQTWALPLLSARGVEPTRWLVQALEALSTPAGSLPAWRVERQSDAPGDSRLSLWLAERLQFLPARILVQESDGDVADQRLLRLPGA